MKERMSIVLLLTLPMIFISLAVFAATSTQAPDLTIQSLNIPAQAKEGDPVQNISVIIKNQGMAQAGATQVRLNCDPVDHSCRCSCPPSLNLKTYPVPAIISGSSATISIPTLPNETWKGHDYAITATIDPGSLVQESDETNNSKSMTVAVKRIVPPLSAQETIKPLDEGQAQGTANSGQDTSLNSQPEPPIEDSNAPVTSTTK